jgi:hypothetical protein
VRRPLAALAVLVALVGPAGAQGLHPEAQYHRPPYRDPHPERRVDVVVTAGIEAEVGLVEPPDRRHVRPRDRRRWSLCAPPRLYNQITMAIAEQMGTDLVDLTRLLALVNVAMADAGIAVWESKYHYQFWRPVTGIRESDPVTGPTGAVTATRLPWAIRPSRRWARPLTT